jgi:hypothetical protein
MADAAALRQKATDLRDLADEIETVLDAAHSAADSRDWQCANADDVRGQLSSYRTSAKTAAGHLRDEADDADDAATAAAQTEDGE